MDGTWSQPELADAMKQRAHFARIAYRFDRYYPTTQGQLVLFLTANPCVRWESCAAGQYQRVNERGHLIILTGDGVGEVHLDADRIATWGRDGFTVRSDDGTTIQLWYERPEHN